MRHFYLKSTKYLYIILLLIIIEIACAHLYSYEKSTNDQEISIDITRTTTWADVTHYCVTHKLYHTAWQLRAYIFISGYTFSLQPGEYVLYPGMSFRSFVLNIQKGKQKIYKLSIIPGMNWHQLYKAIQELPLAHIDRFAHFALPSLEGYFYPDTYFFTKNYPMHLVLNQARHTMLKHITKLYEERSPNLTDFSPQDILTIASIIERETAIDAERPKVARVIYNRLSLGMPLQIDATMAYVAINNNMPFHASMLQETHPFNTYKNHGLPPEPIAYPSLSALHAAVHPEDGPWLYYRVYCGISHKFTSSFEEHRKVIPCQN